MANASVEKLKALGIRHGEKAVVGLTATIFVVFLFLGITNPTMEMQPKELEKTAAGAKSNLLQKQDESKVLAKLETDGLKEPNFHKIIEGQIANALKPDDYRARLEWVSPEPGAGLIRDQPELVAPFDLTAFPGRGGILMYALDANGEREIDKGDPKTKNGGRGNGALAIGGAGPGGGPDSKKEKKETAEEKRRREAEEKRQRELIAGKVDPAEKKEKGEAEAAPAGPYKEEVKGKRWVVITAQLDNAKLKKNYLMALKNEAIAYPNFRRVEVERQTLQYDGTWTEWAPTAKEKNYEVLDNLPEYDTEFVPENQRPSALVDPLPFLKAGYWTGVHVAKLVPSEIRDKPKDAPGGGSSNSGSKLGGMKNPGGSEGESRPGSSSSGSGKMMGGPGMAGGPGVSGGGGGGEEMNFTKYEEGILMVRSLDFTVDPDETFRFRLRIVVVNPNYNRSDVNPGVDVESKSLIGPWSEPSPAVHVPADVVAYAQAPDTVERRDDLITFQVVRWVPENGQTVIKTDARGPGEIIGEYGAVQMPDSEGKGPKSTPVDFNSRSIVLDTLGGRQKMPDIGLPRNQFEVPAMAMIVQPDGDVVVRSQAFDRSDVVRLDMETNYKLALEDSSRVKEKSSGARSGGKGKSKGKGRGKGKGGMGGSMGGASRSG